MCRGFKRNKSMYNKQIMIIGMVRAVIVILNLVDSIRIRYGIRAKKLAKERMIK